MNAYAEWLRHEPTDDTWPAWRQAGVEQGYETSLLSPPIEPLEDDVHGLEADGGAPPSELEYEPVDEGEPPFPGESIIGARPKAITLIKTNKPMSWAEIMAEPDEPVPTIAPGIPKVGLTVLAGSPKVGKSLYLTETALTVGRTLLVFEEGSRSGIAYRLRRQAEALNVKEPDLRLLHLAHMRLDNRENVKRLRELVAEYKPVMVGLDPLNRLHGADENRPSQMTPVMDALAGIAYDFGCSVTCVHHLGKPSMERRGDIWDRFRGASSIRSGTDSNLILDNAGHQLHLVGEFRDAEPLSRYLVLDRDTLTFSEGEAPDASKVKAVDLLAFVLERGETGAREVMAAFGCSRNIAKERLDALAELDKFEGARGEWRWFPRA
jgi:hypothetical protein